MPLTDTCYKIIFPARGNFQSEWDNCLAQLSVAASSQEDQLCRMIIFVESATEDDFRTKKLKINSSLIKLFGNDLPPYAVLAQAPEESYHVAIEALHLKNTEGRLTYSCSGKSRYCTLENESVKQLWSEGLESLHPAADTESAANGAFESMLNILNKEGMNFDNIVRQWNYIGDILAVRKTGMAETQNYQIFNEVRHFFYQKYKRTTGFPAATGIGCKYNQALIGFYAIKFKSGGSNLQIDNPLQTNPYAYSQDKLVGVSVKSELKNPPEFVRGRLVSYGNGSVLFVSGTAAITCQEVTGTGDIETQTVTTIMNIKSLAEDKNVRHYAGTDLPVPENYSYLRVYVRDSKDIPTVKTICQKYFPAVPSIYIEADICRGSLLMEIETELRS